MTKICPVCNKEFEPEPRQRKYCSSECAKEAHRKQSLAYSRRKKRNTTTTQYTKTCPICGNTFSTYRSFQVYCSPECEKKHKKQYLKTYYALHREEINKKKREWRANNKEKVKAYKHKTYLKKKYPCLNYGDYNTPLELCLNCQAKRCRYE